MGEQKKYQGDNRVAKRNRKFYNSGVKIKTTTSGSAGTESDGAIRSEKDRRPDGDPKDPGAVRRKEALDTSVF